jgi:hypothetical protein
MNAIFTLIPDLKIVQQAVKLTRASQLNIILQQNYTVRIGLESHLRASRFKHFPGGGPHTPRSDARGC